MKVHITPHYRGADDGSGGGIRRVWEAQHEWLPRLGVEIVDHPEHADVINAHAGTTAGGSAPMVASIHGLYWTAEETWDRWAWSMNASVIESIRRASVVTVPSEWVAQAVRRGSLIDPVIVPHGVDTELWEPGRSQGYVLWNKFRVDPACDPNVVNALAERLPDVQFVSTFGDATPNVEITDRIPPEQMRDLVRNAGVYLCTARETFGIGTLEAMAAGVPILGWRWGAQAEFMPHGEAGYLAYPGDLDGLIEGLRYCQANRARLGAAAREVARSFTWRRAVEGYVRAYEMALASVPDATGPQVSIVIRCYNYGRTLERAVQSALAQKGPAIEVVIVDDASTDDTPQVCARLAAMDSRVRIVRNATNLYLAGASNAGIAAARGQYILQLDADDELAPNAVQVFHMCLEADPALSIAYGAMQVVESSGRVYISDWPPPFEWKRQMLGMNQVCYSAMFRKVAWERVGGHRTHSAPAEDADFWSRTTSFGFRAAKVTKAVTLIKHDHGDSASNVTQSPSWPQWFGWSRDIAAVPFATVGEPPSGHASWPVYPHDHPRVSVIIPVGPGHDALVQDAIDSLLAQEYVSWEAIVVDDTGGREPITLPGHPFARLLRTLGPHGTAHARNVGLMHARGEMVVFLDADDYLQPGCLSAAVDKYEENPCAVVVWDWWAAHPDGTVERKHVLSEDADAVTRQSQHVVTALYPKAALDDVGGFDEAMPWEDWDLAIALRVNGWCATRIDRPLMTYRMGAGARREEMYAQRAEHKTVIHAKWAEWLTGRSEMMACRGCGGRAPAHGEAQGGYTPAVEMSAVASMGGVEPVLIEYAGQMQNVFSVRGQGTGKSYRFGRDGHHTKAYVDYRDAEGIMGLPGFKRADVTSPAVAAQTAPALVARDRPMVKEQAINVPAVEREPVPFPTFHSPPVLEFTAPPVLEKIETANPPEDEGAGFRDPSELSVAQIQRQIPVLGARQLTVWLEKEQAGKARAGVIRAIEDALAVEQAAQARP